MTYDQKDKSGVSKGYFGVKLLKAASLLFAHLFFWAYSLTAIPVAFKEGVFLKDAEVEEILHSLADPLLKAAGLSPQKVRIFLVSTPLVNAASTIGDIIFVNTGLILECSEGEELVAVLAHEIGHLQKHHVVTRIGAVEGALKIGLGALGLGAVLTALTGNPSALFMGLAAGQHVAERSFLKFTREQESEADQASFRLLKKVGWPLGGTVTFMQKLMADRGPLQDSRVVYGQTHPLHEERIRMASLHVREGEKLPLSLQGKFMLMRMKIRAYTLPASQVLGDPGIQGSPYRAYGEAIGLYRQGRLEEALKTLESFGALRPSPYGEELRAQILFEKGDLRGAEAAVLLALKGMQGNYASICVLAAQIKIVLGRLEEARELLEKAALLDPDDSQPWHFLSVIHGQQNRGPSTDLCLAEKHLRLGEVGRAKEYAERAHKNLNPGTPAQLRAGDILGHLTQANLS